MAIYGAKGLTFFPFADSDADESAETYPKYKAGLSLGPLVAVTDTITNSEARNYGDNELQEYVSEFQEIGIDVEVTEVPLSAAAAVLGASLESGGDLAHGAEDKAPYGGLGFYVNKLTREKGVQKKMYQGVFYPKVKANRVGATYNTKGQNISFANGKLHFVGSTAANGKYQVFSKNFDTESEAAAWVAAKKSST